MADPPRELNLSVDMIIGWRDEALQTSMVAIKLHEAYIAKLEEALSATMTAADLALLKLRALETLVEEEVELLRKFVTENEE